MQTVEVIVFFMAAILVGGLIISFVITISPERLYAQVSGVLFPPPLDRNEVQSIDLSQLAGRLDACWGECGFGSFPMSCGSFAVKGPGVMDVNSIVEVWSRYAICRDCNLRIVCSAGGSCGPQFALPTIIGAKCTSTGLEIQR